MADESVPITESAHKREQKDLTGSPSGKRNKREWLAFHGTKQTRVGNDFQVTLFPTPPHRDEKKEASEPSKSDEKEPVVETNASNEVETAAKTEDNAKTTS